MTERRDQATTSVEHISNEFRSHLQSIAFGSSDYMAFHDFYALDSAKYHRKIVLQRLNETLTPEEKLLTESNLRVAETKMALIEYQIDRAKITNTDYYKAYAYVETTMKRLRQAITSGLKENINQTKADELLIHLQVDDDFHDILVNDFMNEFYR
jgi:hypothetical protein